MKKQLSFFFCLALLGLMLTPVQAQTETSPRIQIQENKMERQEERQAVRKENQAERQADKEARQAERQTVRKENRDERADRHASRLRERFGKYATHLQTMITRVEEFISKKKEAGADVAASETLVAQAKTALATATTRGEEAIAEFESIASGDYTTQRDIALGAAETAKEARAGFKTTKDLLVEAIKLLKNNK